MKTPKTINPVCPIHIHLTHTYIYTFIVGKLIILRYSSIDCSRGIHTAHTHTHFSVDESK